MSTLFTAVKTVETLVTCFLKKINDYLVQYATNKKNAYDLLIAYLYNTCWYSNIVNTNVCFELYCDVFRKNNQEKPKQTTPKKYANDGAHLNVWSL